MNMKRLLSLVAFFATLHASAQQVNPVPDYVFANRMSAGRNTVTDTAAYFSIGPRYGATRGMMPPMVVDTASFSANKRNGLLIFSVQKNKFLYWDSVGVKWAEMAGTAGTALTSADTAALLSTRAWRQKGIDSLAAIRIAGSGTINRVPKFTATGTIGNGSIDDSSSSVQMTIQSSGRITINTTTDAGYQFEVNGTARTKNFTVNTSGQNALFSSYYGANSAGENIFIGGGGQSSVGQSGQTFKGAFNTAVGKSAMDLLTTGYENSAFGYISLSKLTSGYDNSAFGNASLRDNTTGYNNSALGAAALRVNTSGYNNSAIGFVSMFLNTTGHSNTAIGVNSLYANTSGTTNVAIGVEALSNNTSGTLNVAIGVDAGRRKNDGNINETSSKSIFVGNDTRALASSDTNEVVIGYLGRGNGSNTVTIGNTSTTQNYFYGALNTGAPSGGSIKPWKLGEAATVSPTSPNRTIRIEIDGTVYYLHAKTTND